MSFSERSRDVNAPLSLWDIPVRFALLSLCHGGTYMSKATAKKVRFTARRGAPDCDPQRNSLQSVGLPLMPPPAKKARCDEAGQTASAQ